MPTPIGIQPFRIVDIDPINDTEINVFCRHIFADLQRRTVLRCKLVDSNGAYALTALKNNLDKPVHHNFNSDIASTASLDWVRKSALDEALFGSDENSFINKFGGELWIDGWNVSINKRIGKDRGFTALYKKNIEGFNGKISYDFLTTRIIPVGFDGITLENNGFVDSPIINKYSEVYSKVINFDEIKWQGSPNNSADEGYETLEEAQEALVQACNDYFESTKCDYPKATFDLNLVLLKDTVEYEEVSILEELWLGDDVTIDIDAMNLLVKQRITYYSYNSITEQYEQITLSDGINENIFDQINDKFDKVPDKEEVENKMQQAIDEAMKLVNSLISSGSKNSYIKFLPDILNPAEIIACDNEDLSAAVYVVRINKNGLGVSTTGYNGNYQGLVTEGKFVINEATCLKFTAALIQGGIITSVGGKLSMSLEDEYFQFVHTEGATSLRIDERGTYIIDTTTGETIASLSAKESWTELKADKVFASNLNLKYMGSNRLYVDHFATNEIKDGTLTNPFASFYELKEHLEKNPIIDIDVRIDIVSSGVIDETFYLNGLYGSGSLSFHFSKNLVLKNDTASADYFAMIFRNINCKWQIYGQRTAWNSADGFMIQCKGAWANAIDVINCPNFSISGLLCDSKGYAIRTYNSNGIINSVDTCNNYSGIGVSTGLVKLNDCIGNNTNAIRALDGAVVHCGNKIGNWTRPVGALDDDDGTITIKGNTNPVASAVYAPTIPPTVQTVKSFSSTSFATYQYAWSSWSSGECKQGEYGGYGNKAGHAFFNISDIRSFISTGTPQYGSTITVTRKNGGGSSGAVNIYLNASTASSASGTPSYANNTLLGTLKWNETKTFTLPPAIVNNLKTTHSSLAFYSSSNTSAYAEPVKVTLNIKVNK